MTTYEQYASGSTNIGHSVCRKLCLGFLIEDYVNGLETRYALHPDGRILFSIVDVSKRPCHDFNNKGREWFKAEFIPDHAEFIGNYPRDMF